MKRFLIPTLIFIAGCTPGASSTPASFFNLTPAAPSLSMQSSSEQIQRAMWESAPQWMTLHMDGTITWFAPDGAVAQAFQERVWLDPLNSRYKIELNGTANSAAKLLKLSDGSTIFNMDLVSGGSESYPFPEAARVGQYIPPMVEGVAYPNPIWGQIGTPLAQLAFPADYAQNKGNFKPLAMDSIAGRETLVIEWTYSENSASSWKMWLDTQTAVILKLQELLRRR